MDAYQKLLKTCQSLGYRGVVILLCGQIGAGKTSVVKFLQQNLTEDQCYIGSEIDFADPKQSQAVKDFYSKKLNKLVFQIIMMASRIRALTHSLAVFNKHRDSMQLVIFDRTFYCIKQFLTFPSYEKTISSQDGAGYEFAVNVAIEATEDFENAFPGLYPVHVFLDRSEEECKLRRAKRLATCDDFEKTARSEEVNILDRRAEGEPDTGKLLNDHLRATADRHVHVNLTGSMDSETIVSKMFSAVRKKLELSKSVA